MSQKFSVIPLLDATEGRVQYVNLDAKFLVELAEEMDDGEEPDAQSIRLRQIAQRLEHLDEQVRNFTGALSADDPVKQAYTAGILEGKRRYLARSNLPLQSSELTPDLAAAVAKSTVPVKKLPTGKPKPPVKPSALSLAGIKLTINLRKSDD